MQELGSQQKDIHEIEHFSTFGQSVDKVQDVSKSDKDNGQWRTQEFCSGKFNKFS